MSLADRLSATKTRQPCVIGRLVASMPDADRTALTAALEAGKQVEHVARALTEEGYHASATSLRRHQTGGCCCGTA